MERLDAACDFDLSYLWSKYSKYFSPENMGNNATLLFL